MIKLIHLQNSAYDYLYIKRSIDISINIFFSTQFMGPSKGQKTYLLGKVKDQMVRHRTHLFLYDRDGGVLVIPLT